MTMNNMRANLSDAQVALANAIAAQKAAHEATSRAASFVEANRAEVQKHVDCARDATSIEVQVMSAAIKRGQAPIIKGVQKLAEAATARLHAQAALEVAEGTLAALVDEEKSADGAVAGAKAAISQAVRAVMAEEATRIAAQVDLREDELMRLRTRLGGEHSLVGARLAPLSAPLAKCLVHNDTTAIGTRNTAEWRMVQDAALIWDGWEKDLVTDANASLRFS